MGKQQAGGVWLSSVPGVLIAGASSSLGCTLLADAFEPSLLVSGSDAGPSVAAFAPDAAGPARPARVCRSGTELAADRDPSCAASIGLVTAADAGLDAAVGAPPSLGSPSLMLGACASELGPFGPPEPLLGIEFEENAFGPALSPDGRTLYFSAYVQGEQELYAATRRTRSAAFSDVVELAAVNSTGADGSPFLTSDGGSLYFFSDRQVAPGNRNIWVSARALDGGFAPPALVESLNTQSSELLPWLSPDERRVLFVSNRSGGPGGADVWTASRPSPDAAFGAPVNVVELSSEDNEGRAVLSADGSTAFFTSDRGGAGPDIWTASRPDTDSPFSGLRPLQQLNSPQSEVDVMLSGDDREIFFASARRGVSELWRAVRDCP